MNKEIEKQFFDLLSACMVCQQNFDKKPDQLITIAKTWLAVIPEELHAQVPAAIKLHLRQSSRFPTPADILAILDPQPQLDGAYYRELLRRRRNREEKYGDKEYIAAYEERAWQRMRAKPAPAITCALPDRQAIGVQTPEYKQKNPLRKRCN